MIGTVTQAAGTGTASQSSRKTIIIEGIEFEYKPILGNDGSSVLTGDLAINNWKNQTKYAKILEYTTGDPSSFDSWREVEVIGAEINTGNR